MRNYLSSPSHLLLVFFLTLHVNCKCGKNSDIHKEKRTKEVPIKIENNQIPPVNSNKPDSQQQSSNPHLPITPITDEMIARAETGNGRNVPWKFLAKKLKDLKNGKKLDINEREFFEFDYSAYSALGIAAIIGDLDIINALIECGTDLNLATDPTGYTPLHLALDNGHPGIAKLLIEKGAEVNVTNCTGTTPLHRAVMKNYIEIVQLLLDKKADINELDGHGEPALYNAVRGGNKDIVELLLKAGASLYQKSPYAFTTALHLAPTQEIAEILIAQGMDVNEIVYRGETPLHWAANQGHVEVAKLLLAKGADKNAKNDDGATPLHMAAQKHHADIVKLLLDNGANKD